MAGILSKDIKFYTGVAGTPNVYTQVTNLLEIPDMGVEPEKIDVTTLGDSNKTYIAGVGDYGDLAFKFLYDNSSATSNYRVLKGFEGDLTPFKVEFPDGTKFEFTGYVTCKISSAGVNAALTFTATVALNSAISVTDPA